MQTAKPSTARLSEDEIYALERYMINQGEGTLTDDGKIEQGETKTLVDHYNTYMIDNHATENIVLFGTGAVAGASISAGTIGLNAAGKAQESAVKEVADAAKTATRQATKKVADAAKTATEGAADTSFKAGEVEGRKGTIKTQPEMDKLVKTTVEASGLAREASSLQIVVHKLAEVKGLLYELNINLQDLSIQGTTLDQVLEKVGVTATQQSRLRTLLSTLNSSATIDETLSVPNFSGQLSLLERRIKGDLAKIKSKAAGFDLTKSFPVGSLEEELSNTIAINTRYVTDTAEKIDSLVRIIDLSVDPGNLDYAAHQEALKNETKYVSHNAKQVYIENQWHSTKVVSLGADAATKQTVQKATDTIDAATENAIDNATGTIDTATASTLKRHGVVTSVVDNLATPKSLLKIGATAGVTGLASYMLFGPSDESIKLE